MNDHNRQPVPSDENLVAYLDGRLDEKQRIQIEIALQEDSALAERFEIFCRSNLPFQSAFGTLLEQAPTEKLQAMLAALPTPTQVRQRNLSRRGFVAAAASFMIAGVIADRVYLDWRTPTTTHGWRALVAEYMALYTRQTLDNLGNDSSLQDAQLEAVNERLGLSLTASLVALPRPELKRAQILEYDGVPIAQITYLDPEHGPLALCITRSDSGETAPAVEQRLSMNVVFWADATHAYMLIGHNPPDELGAMAQLVRSRLSV
ncbi:anti-sigma factor family protein [Pseudomonas sp. NA-150]|uniref:anti-sigma factor family protein n=1 Tax=Pseudomonas sp. NA-150 TaxID=3367525 RepID=UPI0037C77C7D